MPESSLGGLHLEQDQSVTTTSKPRGTIYDTSYVYTSINTTWHYFIPRNTTWYYFMIPCWNYVIFLRAPLPRRFPGGDLVLRTIRRIIYPGDGGSGELLTQWYNSQNTTGDQQDVENVKCGGALLLSLLYSRYR